MAVDTHPSRRPSPPRKPPAAAPTVGVSGQPGVGYGTHHKVKTMGGKSEFAHHFGSSEGRAPKAGREQSQEGPKGRASKPGDE